VAGGLRARHLSSEGPFSSVVLTNESINGCCSVANEPGCTCEGKLTLVYPL